VLKDILIKLLPILLSIKKYIGYNIYNIDEISINNANLVGISTYFIQGARR